MRDEVWGHVEQVPPITGPWRAAPPPNHRAGPWTWENWSHPWAEGVIPVTESRALSWLTEPSALTMTCRGLWREWSCGTPWPKATAGYSRGALVKLQHWWWATRQSPWIRPTTYYNKQLQVKLVEQKNILSDSLQLPMPLRQIKRWWRGRKDEGVALFLFLLQFVYLFCCFVCF